MCTGAQVTPAWTLCELPELHHWALSVLSSLLSLQLQYNDYIHYIEPCFKGILVQADRDNREVSVHARQRPLPRRVGVICVASWRPFYTFPWHLERDNAGLQSPTQIRPGNCPHEPAA